MAITIDAVLTPLGLEKGDAYPPDKRTNTASPIRSIQSFQRAGGVSVVQNQKLYGARAI